MCQNCEVRSEPDYGWGAPPADPVKVAMAQISDKQGKIEDNKYSIETIRKTLELLQSLDRTSDVAAVIHKLKQLQNEHVKNIADLSQEIGKLAEGMRVVVIDETEQVKDAVWADMSSCESQKSRSVKSSSSSSSVDSSDDSDTDDELEDEIEDAKNELADKIKMRKQLLASDRELHKQERIPGKGKKALRELAKEIQQNKVRKTALNWEIDEASEHLEILQAIHGVDGKRNKDSNTAKKMKKTGVQSKKSFQKARKSITPSATEDGCNVSEGGNMPWDLSGCFEVQSRAPSPGADVWERPSSRAKWVW